MADHPDELIDYEEDEETLQVEATAVAAAKPEVNGEDKGEVKKGSYVGIHSTGFKDFLLKPELLRAIVDCGFEHPSEGWCNFSHFLDYSQKHPPNHLIHFPNHLQSNKNVFPKLSSVWTFSVKPNPVWVKPPSLFWPLFNN